MSKNQTIQKIVITDPEQYGKYTVKKNAKVSKLRHAFREENIEDIVALQDDNRVEGVISINHIFWKPQDEAKLDSLLSSAEIIKNVPFLKEDENLLDVADKMVNSGATILPVVNEYEKIVGIVRDFDILNILLGNAPAEDVAVRYLYTSPEKIIQLEDPISKIIEIYKREKIRELPVIIDGELQGSVNINSVSRDWFGEYEGTAYYNWLRKDSKYRIQDAIDAATIREEQITLNLANEPTLMDAVDLMEEKHIRTLFIVEEDFHGVLRIEDLIRYLIDVLNVQEPLLGLHINDSPSAEFNEIIIRKTKDIVNKYYSRLRNIGHEVDGYIDFKKIHKKPEGEKGSLVENWEIKIRVAFSQSNVFTVTASDYGYEVVTNEALDKLDRLLRNRVDKITDKTKYTSKRYFESPM